ncbi:hypothetical protein OAT88_01100 [Gammaproteobacteria bacterium]|nr:hypothetical protein [Gammaproteobacteria bacterium]
MAKKRKRSDMYRLDPAIQDFLPIKMEAEDYELSRLDLRTAGKIGAGVESSIAKIRQFTRTNNISTYSALVEDDKFKYEERELLRIELGDEILRVPSEIDRPLFPDLAIAQVEIESTAWRFNTAELFSRLPTARYAPRAHSNEIEISSSVHLTHALWHILPTIVVTDQLAARISSLSKKIETITGPVRSHRAVVGTIENVLNNRQLDQQVNEELSLLESEGCNMLLGFVKTRHPSFESEWMSQTQDWMLKMYSVPIFIIVPKKYEEAQFTHEAFWHIHNDKTQEPSCEEPHSFITRDCYLSRKELQEKFKQWEDKNDGS